MRAPRLLFVFSADYGEAINAELFTHGQGFDVAAVLPSGSRVDISPVCGKAGSYRTIDDIVDAVARFRPDVVLFASAYLYAVNDTLAPLAVTRLMQHARRESWRVVTTDPWMGYWRTRPQARFNLYGFRDARLRRQAEHAMRHHQRELDHLLDDVVHVYATPYVDAARTSFSFFNGVAVPERVQPTESNALFVLSREDYRVQWRKHENRFYEHLSGYFRHLLDTGFESVTLLAPPSCSQRVSALCGSQRVNCPGFIDLASFRKLIEGAALVGYWNLLSTSLLYAFYAGRPMVFLDTGHQAELSDGLLDHVVANVYDGQRPAIHRLDKGAMPLVGSRFEYLRVLSGESPATIVSRIRDAAATS